jgi:hypothetical protein
MQPLNQASRLFSGMACAGSQGAVPGRLCFDARVADVHPAREQVESLLVCLETASLEGYLTGLPWSEESQASERETFGCYPFLGALCTRAGGAQPPCAPLTVFVHYKHCTNQPFGIRIRDLLIQK